MKVDASTFNLLFFSFLYDNLNGNYGNLKLAHFFHQNLGVPLILTGSVFFLSYSDLKYLRIFYYVDDLEKKNKKNYVHFPVVDVVIAT